MDDQEWLTVEAAAHRLGVTTRQVNRLGHGDRARLRVMQQGRRLFYHRDDVEALARERGVARQLAPPPSRADLIPAGEMLDYLRERDDHLRALEDRLQQLAMENGALRARLEDVQAERDRIRQQITDAQKRRWWRFWTRDGRS